MGAARRLAEYLAAHREQVGLYRQLTMLRTDVPLEEGIADLEWRGVHESLKDFCAQLGANDIPDRIPRWISK